ncbi:hypothetical protein [Streptomyces sp. NPDC058326]|uniref:hypothetical protein n=1 Tax=Streptomyces sp. NPDC058326 TaxID=3346447 RepID=UPI0036EE9BAC
MRTTTRRSGRRFLSVAGTLALSVTALLAGGGAAGAATDSATASVGIQDATLGWTCVGPSYNRKFAFTVNSTTGVPAGSTWRFTVSKAGYQGLQVLSDSAYVPSASGSTVQVNLSAPSGVPAATTVTLQPVYYLVPTSGYNTLTLSGYGGSVSYAMSTGNRPC